MIEMISVLAVVDPTTVTMLVSACGILGSAVGYLYKQQTAFYKEQTEFHRETRAELEQCVADRILLHQQQNRQWEMIARLSGKQVDELKKDMDID